MAKQVLLWCTKKDMAKGRKAAAAYPRPKYQVSWREPWLWAGEVERAPLHVVVGTWPKLVKALEAAGQKVVRPGDHKAQQAAPQAAQARPAGHPYHLATGGGWYSIHAGDGEQVDRVQGRAAADAAVAALAEG
jgi:hypothetical protein